MGFVDIIGVAVEEETVLMCNITEREQVENEQKRTKRRTLGTGGAVEEVQLLTLMVRCLFVRCDLERANSVVLTGETHVEVDGVEICTEIEEDEDVKVTAV